MSQFAFLAAADTANMKAGGMSFFDNPLAALGGGVGGAITSGILSIYNTAVSTSNKVFGTSLEEKNVSDVLASVDAKWADYYNENQDTIDTLGFIGTSFIPGGLAIKGLKMAQAGRAGKTFQNVLGYTSTKTRDFYVKGMQEIAAEGGTVFNHISKNRALASVWDVADSALQTVAFETAVAATMNQSPFFEGKEASDLMWDAGTNVILGAGVGGAIGHLVRRADYKKASSLVDTTVRKFDTPLRTGDIGLNKGDKTYELVNALSELPNQIPATTLQFKGLDLNVTDLLKSQKEKTKDALLIDVEQALNGFSTDSTVSGELRNAIGSIVREAVESDIPRPQLRQRLGDYLFGLKRADPIPSHGLTDLTGDVVYLIPKKGLHEVPQFSLQQTEGAIPFRTIGNHADAKVLILGQKGIVDFTSAWKAGVDIAIAPIDGSVHVSPKSTILKKVKNPDENLLFFNTATKQTSATTVPTAADMAPHGEELVITKQGVSVGDRSWTFSRRDAMPEDALTATARHAWASKLKVVDGVISKNDISLLDAILEKPMLADNMLRIDDQLATAIPNLSEFVLMQKRKRLMELLQQGGDKGADLREIAYRINSTPEWAENAISVKFDPSAMAAKPGMSRPLADATKRENIVLAYDANIKPDILFETDGLVHWHQRVKEATERSKNAATAVLGTWAEQLGDVPETITRQATGSGTGATLLTASNANYDDTLGVWTQSVGATVNKVKTAFREQALRVVQPSAAKLISDEAASAELVAATNMIRGNASDLALMVDEVPGTLGVPTKKYSIVDHAWFSKSPEARAKAGPAVSVEVNPLTGEFLEAFQRGHGDWIEKHKLLMSTHGVDVKFDPTVLYLPPIDTRKVPFFAFIRETEGKIFGTSDVAMLSARSAEELRAAAAQAEKDGYQVIFKSDTKEYHKAKADYDYGRGLNSPTLNNYLRSKGRLADTMPSFSPNQIIQDYVEFIARREDKLVRDAVSTRYAQQIAELQNLSEQAVSVQTSKFQHITERFKSVVQDPYGDYMRQMFDISKRGEFTLLHQANEFVDALGTRAYAALDATFEQVKNRKLNWEDANKVLDKYGLGKAIGFSTEDAFISAQHGPDQNVIRTGIQKLNTLVATGMLRLDFANSLINVVSTPILLGTEVAAIRSTLKKQPELLAGFNSKLEEVVPGEQLKVPSTLRLLYNAIKNYAGDSATRNSLLQRYRDINVVKDPKSLYHDMIDDLSGLPKLVPKKWDERLDKWVEKGATWTGNNRAEEMTRFVSADVMRQLTEDLVTAGKMSITEQNAFIQTFVNRVQGNYIASQRPILFQGTLGAAIGLFQTYQFNVFQQLFRHIGDKNARAILTMGGLQGSLYGLNGMPLFNAINTHLIGGAESNYGHEDIYNKVVKGAGKELGDWMMYGSVSALPFFSEKSPALYTRGDLNPRNWTIIPTSPLEVPAVGTSINVVKTLMGVGSQIAKGTPVGDALLWGLQFNSLNRPLAGLAQVMAGRSTTRKGELIAMNNDLVSMATFSRLLGSRPMDESIGLETHFRQKAYEAMDKDKIEKLGMTIKNRLKEGQLPSFEELYDFQARYVQSGGRIEGFTQAIQRWQKASNVSLLNRVMEHSQTAEGQRMAIMLGGVPIED